MKEYPKINSIFMREPTKKPRLLLMGRYSTPEFEYLKDNIWTWREKINGMNIRIGWSPDTKQITFAGRTINAQLPIPLKTKLNEMFFTDKFMEVFPTTPVILFGEGFGRKIQNGGNYIKDGVSFILFDILIADWWLKEEDISGIAKELRIESVPIIGEGTLIELIEVIKSGLKSRWGDFPAEGIVAVPKVHLKDRRGNRIITKLKHNDFPRSDK